MKKAIVTDMRYRMALSPARCLARAGYQVTGVEFASTPEKEAIGFYSKCLTDRRFLPEESFAKGLLELSEELRSDGERPIIVPVGRKAIEAAFQLPQMAGAADFIVPSPRAMELSDDKWRLYELACRIAVPVPFTTALSQWNSLEELAEKAVYPSFIKFRNGELLGLKPVERYRIVNTPGDLMDIYPKMDARDKDPIVQELVIGRDVGIAAVMDKDGRMVDYICYESLREFPASGGPTCLCRTVESPKMVEYAEKLLSAVGYTGIAMLDFKGSPQEPKLLEINPRIWGSANICDVSGATFFVSYARAASGERLELPAEPGYKVGVTMRFSPQDAASLISYLRQGRPIVKTVSQYIKTALDPSIKNGVKRRGDMGPHRRYMLNLLKR